MARPREPLISRDATVAAAIRIIDAEGLEALSLPRLARAMNVKAPSLYHHFADKSAILESVAREIVSATVIPRKPPADEWVEWLVQLCLNFRSAVLRHRNAAPVLLQHLPRDLLADIYEDVAVHLDRCGLAKERHLPVLDGLNRIAVTATLAEALRPEGHGRSAMVIDEERHPTLAASARACRLGPRQQFECIVRTHLRGIARQGPTG
ncbi:MAG TPA: TetR family transcriptional regulator [Marmoricola sp.]|nr:TetR family transcriptional regulator [Marmoricola sp.]